MNIPWFMQCHIGIGNTLVGVFPTPKGVYCRSWATSHAGHRGEFTGADVYFYPMAPARREPVSIGFFTESPDVENKIDNAIADHMTSIGLSISDF
jgi:hypothetical protein